MDKTIEQFLDAEKNLTFCTSVENIPHCVNCFYTFIADGNLLVFKSDSKTRHIENARLNNRIAGTIVPNIHKVGKIKGVQFTGKFFQPEGDILKTARKKYYLKHPIALTLPGELWAIELLTVKMIDNTLGFGKKVLWEKTVSEKSITG